LMEKIQTGLINPKVAMARILEAEDQHGIEELMTTEKQPPAFEAIKHDNEMKYKYAQLMLEAMDKEEQWVNDEILTHAKSMLDIAKAEGEEVGAQLNEYNAELQSLIHYAEEGRKIREEKLNAITKRQQNNNSPTAGQP